MLLPLSQFATRLREFIRQSASAAPESETPFNELALDLFALQIKHNAAYGRFCERRQIGPQQVTHWSQIPAMPTSAFKELDITSLQPEERTHSFHSSGTTGQRPSRHFHFAESLSLYEASLLSWFERHLLPDRSERIRLLSLTPPPATAPNSSLVHMFETVRRQYHPQRSLFASDVGQDGLWIINFSAAMNFFQDAVREATPVLILGTAFNYVELLDRMGKERLRLPPTSRVLETGGYKGRSRAIPRSELHALISEHFTLPLSHIVTEYGMSELSSQAYDGIIGTPKRNAFQFPPWARAQIISPETGEPVAEGQTGLIRVFDLANVWSVMAIQTEDLGIARASGFDLLGRAKAAELRGCSLMAAAS